jgi:serine/threonine protein kinase
MSVPATSDELLELIRKSGLISLPRLDSYLENRRTAGKRIPPKAQKLAGLLIRDGLLTYYQVKYLLQGRWRGFLRGNYKILERLGPSSKDRVYLCEHLPTGRRVAIKGLPAVKLDHPNIAGVRGIRQDGEQHFIVLEFIDGNNLETIVREHGPLDILRAAHYIRQAAEGLHHVHQTGSAHRHLKPSHFILDRQGTIKIIGLAPACFFAGKSHAGTADYLAPELAFGPSDLGIQANIYSLGATLYFLLTSLPPFQGKPPAENPLLPQGVGPTPIRVLRPDLPEELAAVVEKMIARDPAQRYSTMAEVVEALAPWTQTPIPPPPAEEMPQFCRAARGDGHSDAASAPPVSPATLEAGVPQGTEQPDPEAALIVADTEPDTGLTSKEVEISDPELRLPAAEQESQNLTTDDPKTEITDPELRLLSKERKRQTATTELFEEDIQPAEACASPAAAPVLAEPEQQFSIEHLVRESEQEIPQPENEATLSPTPSPTRRLSDRKSTVRNSERRGWGWGMVAAAAAVLLLILIVVLVVAGLSGGRDEEGTDDRSIPELLEAMKHQDPETRAEAVHSLGHHAEEAATVVPALIEALKDKDKEVRLAAIQALGQLGPEAKKALAALKKFLKDRDEDLREAAEEALEQIQKDN